MTGSLEFRAAVESRDLGRVRAPLADRARVGDKQLEGVDHLTVNPVPS